jgi:hypothetical protein
MRPRSGIYACLILSCFTLPTQAQDVVTNGGFETGATEYGVPTGWTTNAPSGSWIFADNGSFAGAYGAPGPHSGTWDMLIGPYSDYWLNQSLLTQVGQQYQVNYWLYNKAGSSSNDFSVYWGGTTPTANEVGAQANGQQLLSLNNAGSFEWTQYTYTVTATSNSTNLTFFGNNGSYFYGLDDVSVVPLGGAVPECGTLFTALLGLTAVTFLRRRRIRKPLSMAPPDKIALPCAELCLHRPQREEVCPV